MSLAISSGAVAANPHFYTRPTVVGPVVGRKRSLANWFTASWLTSQGGGLLGVLAAQGEAAQLEGTLGEDGRLAGRRWRQIARDIARLNQGLLSETGQWIVTRPG